MMQSEFVLTSLVTRLNALIDGRHIDELNAEEYFIYCDRFFAIKLVSDTFGYEIINDGKDGYYKFSYRKKVKYDQSRADSTAGL